MKRKSFRILFALVLALSFSLVTAVPMATPAKAAPDTLNVYPLQLIETGANAVAEWSTTQKYTGSYSAHLDTTAASSPAEATIVIQMPAGTTLGDIDTISWWRYIAVGYAPHLDIKLDVNGDGSFAGADDEALVIQYAYNTVAAHYDSGLPYYGAVPGDWYQTFDDDGVGPAQIDDTTSAWAGTGSAGPPDGSNPNFINHTLAEWKAGVTYTADTFVEKTINVNTLIYALEIEVDYWAAPIDAYVDDIAINGVVYYGLIQDAIDTATATGDTISVAAGTYTEDLAIPTGKDNLELKPATGAAVTIKGVASEPDASFPLAVPNIDILSSGVKIHGFTIEGPDDVSEEYASGMLIGASSVEIYDNAFKVTAGRATYTGSAISTGIITYRKTAVPTVDISGLNIHDNTFTNHGTGAAGYDGIFINLDTGTGTITIADNQFTGNFLRAMSVERSNVVISGNSIVTDLAPYASSAGSLQGIYVGCYPVGGNPGPVSANVSITGNTVKGATTSEGFAQGIRVGHTTQVGLTNITVSRNIVQDSDEGITVRADATGVTVNYNDIRGNTVGVQNDDTGVELDAEYNWYGGVAGPVNSTNPYVTEAAGNDTVSDDVDFLPWMIHTELVSGWNIYSTPIAPGAASNTIAKALDLWTTDTGSYTIGWYFNGATQAWVQVLGTTPLQPMQAVYLNMSANATIDVVVSAEYTSPPQAVMSAGWNLIGPSALEPMHVDVALLSAKFGAGAPDLWGYSQVHSPALHQTLWTFQRVDIYVDEDFVPTEGYWVHMVNAGLLAGFTSTPIEP